MAKIMDEIEADSLRVDLWDALCDAIDLVCDHPESAAARKEAWRGAQGEAVWGVPVRTRTETWRLIWRPEGNHVRLEHFVPLD